jgi:hypothetical protein
MTSHRVLAIAAAALLLSVACDGSGRPDDADGLDVGDDAPAFVLPSAAGDAVSLDGFVGKKPVLLYFSMGPG